MANDENISRKMLTRIYLTFFRDVPSEWMMTVCAIVDVCDRFFCFHIESVGLIKYVMYTKHISV